MIVVLSIPQRQSTEIGYEYVSNRINPMSQIKVNITSILVERKKICVLDSVFDKQLVLFREVLPE